MCAGYDFLRHAMRREVEFERMPTVESSDTEGGDLSDVESSSTSSLAPEEFAGGVSASDNAQ